jgi:hypothetical protein
MRRAVSAVVLAILCAGCTRADQGATTSSDGAAGTSVVVSGLGSITGELRAQGGRYPGVDVLTSGVVSVWSGDATVMVFDVDGRFDVALEAGTYRLAAVSGGGTVPCNDVETTVIARETTTVVVVCNVR